MTQKDTHYYIHGQFTEAQDPNGEWVTKNPGDLNDVLGCVRYSYRAVDEAVQSAKQAQAAWRKIHFSDRAEYVSRYRAVMEKRRLELAKHLAREIGKPLWEAELELDQTLEVISYFLKKKSFDSIENKKFLVDSSSAEQSRRYRPLGVVAVISPFNSPAKISNAHLIPALLAGNTVVHKPSEKAALFSLMMAECFHEAGFPPGVLNLVSGEKEVGRRLAVHEGINGVFFAGSYDVGLRIKQDTLQQYWKFLALELGGKNPMIIDHDIAVEQAVPQALVSAFMSAGQRCSSTSRIFVHQKIIDEFSEKFHLAAKKFTISHPLKNPFMGPVIDGTTVDRFLKFHAIVSREGGEFLMRGKTLELENPGYYVTPSICRFSNPTVEALRKSVFHQTELFAPMVSIIPVMDLDQAVHFANANQYGLVASVLTGRREEFERACDLLEFGMVYWNKPTVGSSVELPYGGWKKSGNFHPMGSEAPVHCTVPMAVFESDLMEANRQLENYPGIQG